MVDHMARSTFQGWNLLLFSVEFAEWLVTVNFRRLMVKFGYRRKYNKYFSFKYFFYF